MCMALMTTTHSTIPTNTPPTRLSAWGTAQGQCCDDVIPHGRGCVWIVWEVAEAGVEGGQGQDRRAADMAYTRGACFDCPIFDVIFHLPKSYAETRIPYALPCLFSRGIGHSCQASVREGGSGQGRRRDTRGVSVYPRPLCDYVHPATLDYSPGMGWQSIACLC